MALPLNGAFAPGLELYGIPSSKNANKPISSLAETAMEQSKFGVKIEEPLAYGWTAIGKWRAASSRFQGRLAMPAPAWSRIAASP